MHGKICYVEIPAVSSEASSKFYTAVFGWNVRTRGDGSRAFDDATGAVSGSWIEGRPPQREAAVLPYVMVDSIDATLATIAANGGASATTKTALGGGAFWATFHDPAGNLVGLYEQHS